MNFTPRLNPDTLSMLRSDGTERDEPKSQPRYAAGTRSFRGALVLLCSLTLASAVLAKDDRSTSVRIPFHVANRLLILDAKVNDSVAKLVLDTGSGVTIVSPKVYSQTRMQSHSLAQDDAGPGYLGLANRMRAEVKLDGVQLSVIVSVMDLDDASKHIGTRIDGILGEDILRRFRAVRIDYRKHMVELEQ